MYAKNRKWSRWIAIAALSWCASIALVYALDRWPQLREVLQTAFEIVGSLLLLAFLVWLAVLPFRLFFGFIRGFEERAKRLKEDGEVFARLQERHRQKLAAFDEKLAKTRQEMQDRFDNFHRDRAGLPRVRSEIKAPSAEPENAPLEIEDLDLDLASPPHTPPPPYGPRGVVWGMPVLRNNHAFWFNRWL